MRNFKKFLSLVLAIIMITGTMMAVSANTAVTTSAPSTSAEAISFLGTLGVFKGVSPTDLGADQLVTREQMAMFIARVKTGQTDASFWTASENTTKFTDLVDPGFFGAIAYAYGIGVINGTSETTFAPTANITYQEAVTMIVRALGVEDKDKPFVYPYGYLDYADYNGITEGLGLVNWTTPITRAQTAQLVYNLLVAETIPVKNTNPVQYTSLLATKFKVTTTSAFVIATENQAFAGSNLAKAGTVTLSDGSIIPAKMLDTTSRTLEEYLGVYFNVTIYNSREVLSVESQTVSTVENFGTRKFEAAEVNSLAVPGHMNVDGKIFQIDTTKIDPNNYPTLAVYKLTSGVVNGIYTTNRVRVTFEQLKDVEYGKLELQDTNNDGVVDTALLTEYMLGKYTLSSEGSFYDYTTKALAEKTKAGKMDTVELYSYEFGSSGIEAKKVSVRNDQIKVVGAVKSLAADTFYVFNYNPLTRTVVVYKNLGKAVAKSVTAVTDTTVTIDNVVYKFEAPVIGYMGTASARTQSVSTIKTQIENALSVQKTFKVNIVAIGNKLVSLTTVNASAVNFMVLDADTPRYVDAQVDGKTVKVPNEFVTSYVGVALSGNLLVQAIVDNSGVAKLVEIATINGVDVKLTAAQLSRAELSSEKFGDSTVTYYNLSTTAVKGLYDTTSKAIAAVTALEGQSVFAIVSNASTGYSISSHINSAGTIVATATIANKEIVKFNTIGQLEKNIATANTGNVSSKDKFLANDDTVFMFIGKDGVKVYKGVPKAGWGLNLSNLTKPDPDDETKTITVPTILYRALESIIVVANPDRNVADIASGFVFSETETPDVATEYSSAYYFTGDSKYSHTAIEGGSVVYVYTDVYNLLTNKVETAKLADKVTVVAKQVVAKAVDATSAEVMTISNYLTSVNKKLKALTITNLKAPKLLAANVKGTAPALDVNFIFDTVSVYFFEGTKAPVLQTTMFDSSNTLLIFDETAKSLTGYYFGN